MTELKLKEKIMSEIIGKIVVVIFIWISGYLIGKFS
jgi:hypothetical protein